MVTALTALDGICEICKESYIPTRKNQKYCLICKKSHKKYICIECGKIKATRKNRKCIDCYKLFNKGKNTPNYIDGRTNKPNYCPKCGTLLKSYISKRCKSCSIKGKRNGNWNGGKTTHSGYIYIYKPNHPNNNKQGYTPEHRLIMEKYLGRYLTSNEVVHHINEIKNDNRLENLGYFAYSGLHSKYHSILRKLGRAKVELVAIR